MLKCDNLPNRRRGSDWLFWAGFSPVRKGSSAETISYRPLGTGSILQYSDDPRLIILGGRRFAMVAVGDRAWNLHSRHRKRVQIDFPADAQERTLTLHVGGWNSAGTLIAHLSDGSQPDWVDVAPMAVGQYDRNYRIGYRAGSAGQKLTVSWIMSSGAGNVTMSGAALSVSTLQWKLKFPDPFWYKSQPVLIWE